MKSLLQTGASLLLKVQYANGGKEKTIGFAQNLTFTVSQGQKMTYVVDTPFPAEIPQGATPSFVRGSLTTYLPKGTTPESVGLVPYRVNEEGDPYMTNSGYLNFRIYDRLSNAMVLSCDFCKVNSYTVNIMSRGIVAVTFSFDGILLTPGNAI